MTLNDAVALAQSYGMTAEYTPASNPLAIGTLTVRARKSNGDFSPVCLLAADDTGINDWAAETIRQHGAQALR